LVVYVATILQLHSVICRNYDLLVTLVQRHY